MDFCCLHYFSPWEKKPYARSYAWPKAGLGVLSYRTWLTRMRKITSSYKVMVSECTNMSVRNNTWSIPSTLDKGGTSLKDCIKFKGYELLIKSRIFNHFPSFLGFFFCFLGVTYSLLPVSSLLRTSPLPPFGLYTASWLSSLTKDCLHDHVSGYSCARAWCMCVALPVNTFSTGRGWKSTLSMHCPGTLSLFHSQEALALRRPTMSSFQSG